MTTTLDVMKRSITNALELEASIITDSMKWYYRGKVTGVLGVSAEIFNKSEYDELWAHYKSEEARFS